MTHVSIALQSQDDNNLDRHYNNNNINNDIMASTTATTPNMNSVMPASAPSGASTSKMNKKRPSKITKKKEVAENAPIFLRK